METREQPFDKRLADIDTDSLTLDNNLVIISNKYNSKFESNVCVTVKALLIVMFETPGVRVRALESEQFETVINVKIKVQE